MAKLELKMDGIQLDPEFFGPKQAEVIALQEVETTIARTNAAALTGANADGESWHQYSEVYKEQIEAAAYKPKRNRRRRRVFGEVGDTYEPLEERELRKSGRGLSKKMQYLRKKAGHTSPPNLFVSGKLHQSRRAFRVQGGAEGRVTPARPNMDGSKNPPNNAELIGYLEALGYTDFHAFGDQDIDRITKRFEEEIARAAEQSLAKITKRT